MIKSEITAWPVLKGKLLLLTLLVSLSACDNDEPPRARIIPIQANIDDPAMADAVISGSEQEQTENIETKVDENPQEFTVDLGGKRIFFPEQGWVSAQDFWTIYYEQPEKLPAEIDFELLEKLKETTNAVESD